MFRYLLRWFRSRRSSLDLGPPKPPHDPGDETLAVFLAAMQEREECLDALPTCDLNQYREFVRYLPRPSEAQIEDFVGFVSEDHSWYKKLPLLPPGDRFRFFLDPLAGLTRLIQPPAGVVALERTEDGGAWRFSTNEYRSRFGHLACDVAGGVRYVDIGLGPHGEYGECDVFCVGDRAYRIPAAVSEIGSVEVTAVIHPQTARTWVWREFLPRQEGRSWPYETGGESTLRQIRDLCARQQDLGDEISIELEALLSPERQRLQSQMKDAIRRVLDRVYLTEDDGSP